MNRRQILKGILVVPLLPLFKLAPVPAARLEHAWRFAGIGSGGWHVYTNFSGCMVWNRALGQVEMWSLHEHASGQHLDGCICEG